MEKHARFQRALKRRLPRVMVELDLIANLAMVRYKCSDDEAEYLVSELDGKLKYIKGLFKKRLELNAKNKI
ncbi:hypothetical protein [Bacillus thuringiensis]|uniref:hypothetical protein n=1 Tax=Bacillus thuringiensis TaxID=1428 RepID=UPI000BFA61E4|nr:hypothetical protein [Bacillus thuringiensis]PFA02224.1 hypothetical protein CN379_28100 [Bacillus thuringiensis]